MQKGLLLLALGATLAIGFLAGRVSSGTEGGEGSAGGEGGSGNNAQSPRRTKSGERDRAEAGGTPMARLRQEIRQAPPDQLGKLVYRALEFGDPLTRRTLLMDLFARMDAGNFRAMTDEVSRISLETGRSHYDEWQVAHSCAGKVGGQAAMEQWNQPDKLGSEQALRTISGWASADPEAAKRWVEENPNVTPTQRARLLAEVAAGAIRADPDQAKKLMADLPESDQVACVTSFTYHMVQNYGKDGALDWLGEVVGKNPESAYARSASQSVFDKLVWAGSNQTDARTMVADMERFSSTVPLDEGWIVRALGQIRGRSPIGGIEYLDKIIASPVLGGIPLGDRSWNSAVDYALQRDRPAVEKWLAANPDSPIHGKVAEYAARPQQAKRGLPGPPGAYEPPEIPGR